MLDGIISFSLRYRLVVLVAAVILLVIGLYNLQNAAWDVFPEFAPPQVVIQTEAPGLTTEEVEQLVTIPVESAVSGVTRVRTVRSSSVPGLSVVTAIFAEGTDVLTARQLVSERIAEIRSQLPTGVASPRMTPLAASTSRLLMVGLTSEKVSLQELRTLADWTFRRRLQAVTGVAHVEVFGGEVKQYQVLVSPERLQQYRVSLDEVEAAAQSATGFGGAGYVETANQRLGIQQRTQIDSPLDVAAVPVSVENGVAITLGQVADVDFGPADKPGDATINGRPGVILLIHKQPSFNTLTVTEKVESAVEQLRGALSQDVQLHTALFRQATFIERAIGNLTLAITVGCVLVALVLIAFLFEWRTVAISLTAIPLSLLGAILVLRGLGISLNAMTLGGLAIALGELVDDAIVDVENVLRRLRDNARQSSPDPAWKVVLKASLEVRGAIVYASFIVILVFLPVFFLEGLAGTFFRPLGLAYICAILVSLIVALTVTPAMCLWLLPGRVRRDVPDAWLVRMLKAMYGRMLPAALRFPRFAVGLASCLTVAAVASLIGLGGEFLPEFRESNFVIFMAGSPEASLSESVRMGKPLAEKLLGIGGVKSVAQQIGRADLSEDTWGPNVSEVWVALNEDADYDHVLDEIREETEEIPGAVFHVKQFLRERIDEVLTGTTADIVIRVVGPDLEKLRSQAERIAEKVEPIAGIEDLAIEQQILVPQLEIRLRPRDTAQFALAVGDVNQDLQTLLKGTTVGQVFEEDRVFDCVVRAHPDVRSDPLALKDLLIDLPTGEKVPLHAVADVRMVEAPNVIHREQASRRILITCNAEDRDVVSVMRDIRAAVGTAELPSGYHLEFGGQYEAHRQAQRRLLLLGSVALLAIFALLYLDLRRVSLALLIMLSVPFAAVGGIAAIWLAGGDISLGSMIGLVTVFGVAVRNGILLISHYEHLRQEEQLEPGPMLLLCGASDRLAPVLMTASTTALALLPLVLRGDLPGHEIEHPMAIVIIGGLISSTALTLFILPILYQWITPNHQQAT